MRSYLVVVSTPVLHFSPRIVKAHEPVGVQTLGPELAVEAFDKGIVDRLSGPGKVEHNTLLVRPEIQIAGDELGPLVHPDRHWIARLLAYPFECRHNVFAPIAVARVNRRAIAREGIDDGQHAQFAAGRQLVMDEVHGPDLVAVYGLATVAAQRRS